MELRNWFDISERVYIGGIEVTRVNCSVDTFYFFLCMSTVLVLT